MDPKRRRRSSSGSTWTPSKKARAYSRGNRQKVALIAALASDAELLLLDEPNRRPGPRMEGSFRECVHGSARRPDLLLSSHILAEAAALSDRVTIIRGAGPWRPAPWPRCTT